MEWKLTFESGTQRSRQGWVYKFEVILKPWAWGEADERDGAGRAGRRVCTKHGALTPPTCPPITSTEVTSLSNPDSAFRYHLFSFQLSPATPQQCGLGEPLVFPETWFSRLPNGERHRKVHVKFSKGCPRPSETWWFWEVACSGGPGPGTQDDCKRDPRPEWQEECSPPTAGPGDPAV